jgi:hypothetical protein
LRDTGLSRLPAVARHNANLGDGAMDGAATATLLEP